MRSSFATTFSTFAIYEADDFEFTQRVNEFTTSPATSGVPSEYLIVLMVWVIVRKSLEIVSVTTRSRAGNPAALKR